MPPFRYIGPGSRFYPENRDALNRPVGAVEPGDEREFDTAPDQWWAPAQDNAQDEPGGEQAGAPDETAASSETGALAAPDEAPGPVPAPPAVVPGV